MSSVLDTEDALLIGGDSFNYFKTERREKVREGGREVGSE